MRTIRGLIRCYYDEILFMITAKHKISTDGVLRDKMLKGDFFGIFNKKRFEIIPPLSLILSTCLNKHLLTHSLLPM